MLQIAALFFALTMGLPSSMAAESNVLILRSVQENELKPEDEESFTKSEHQFIDLVNDGNRRRTDKVIPLTVRISNFDQITSEVTAGISGNPIRGIYFQGHGNEFAYWPSGKRGYSGKEFAALLIPLLEAVGAAEGNGLFIYFDSCHIAEADNERPFLIELGESLKAEAPGLAEKVVLIGHVKNAAFGAIYSGEPADQILARPELVHRIEFPWRRQLAVTLITFPLLLTPMIAQRFGPWSIEGAAAVVFGSGIAYVLLNPFLKTYRALREVHLVEAQFAALLQPNRRVRVLANNGAVLETMDVTAVSHFLDGRSAETLPCHPLLLNSRTSKQGN